MAHINLQVRNSVVRRIAGTLGLKEPRPRRIIRVNLRPERNREIPSIKRLAVGKLKLFEAVC